MNVLIYRYGSICEPDIIDSFQKAGLQVIEEKTEITQKNLTNEQRIDLVEKALKEFRPLFVFSVNFYPVIAEICHIYRTLYLCWTVDSPVPELFSPSIRHDTNRIFLFDHAQYTRFSPYNPGCIFHLPLAAAAERFDRVIETITPKDEAAFSSQISFVGSLYAEKSPLGKMQGLSDYTKGYLNALMESSLKVYGCNFTEEALNPRVIEELKQADPGFYQPKESIASMDTYIAAHSYLGQEIAVRERMRTLNTLAQRFPVDLYTRSDSSSLRNVRVHGGVATLTEMPKIFHLSKINLNMTIKPIQEGLPLRIFDILGCGGFCMTNYQPELPEYFEIGTDLEAYSSLEELVDKCQYYLTHEEARQQIARSGWQKVREKHNYMQRIKEMISLASR